MGCLVALLAVIYFISPIDFLPGLIDDILCIIIAIFLCAKSGVDPYKSKEGSNENEEDE